MAEATPPSTSPGSSTTAHTSLMFRNIIVGVTTTILGSTAVYFLGFHKKGGSESKAGFLEVKEATTRAWKNYVTIDNIYYKNLISINKDEDLITDLDRYKSEMFKEGARFKKDAQNIIDDKDIDKAFVSMMERRFDREAEAEDAITTWFNKLKTIRDSDDTPEEKQTQMLKETKSYQTKTKGILERTVNEMEDLAQTLTERYGQQFNLNDIQSYVDYKSGKFNTGGLDNNTGNNNTGTNTGNPQDPKNDGTQTTPVDATMFPGRWSTTGANIQFTNNGNFFWDVLSTGDKSSGTWSIQNNQLYMYPQIPENVNKTTWVFNLSVSNPNLFTMTLSVQPFNSYTMARIHE